MNPVNLRIVTINICGLNDQAKRLRAAIILKAMRADILCLQETHIEGRSGGILEQLGFRLLMASNHGTKTRGVAILTRRKDIEVKRKLSDRWGRWVVLSCAFAGEPFTLGSLYGSTADDPEVLEYLDVELANWPSPLLLCGDFNIDGLGGLWGGNGSIYSGRKKRVFKALTNLVNNHGLIDLWHHLNDKDPGSTFFSAPHKRVFRLDYFFVSHSLAYRVKIEKYPRILSDHNPLVLTWEFANAVQGERSWTFERGLLLNSDYITHMKKWIKTYWDINRYSARAGVVWDAFKAGIRGETLSFSLLRQKKEKQREVLLHKNLVKIEEELATAVKTGLALEDIILRLAWAKAEIGDRAASKAAELFLAKREESH